MPLFGFAIDFTDGSTDYALVSAENETGAEADILLRCLEECMKVETIVQFDAETVVQEEFGGCAFLLHSPRGR